MRFHSLNLVRYGKFTDHALAFPRRPRDFHMVIGANEAGKSTTRGAVLDLLYGIEQRSTLNFLHAHGEMRLAATLQHDGSELEFARVKARKSLLDVTGAALDEAALAVFLAGTKREFFDQMFGLDQARLEAGGKHILSASNDIGQILFQSAAGIASLGKVRDALTKEADSLWGARKASGRAYSDASDQLARADSALKDATIRTKDWAAAVAKAQELEGRRDHLRARYQELELERTRLERVRRVAPALRRVRETAAELEQLGAVVVLPSDAAARLNETERELAGSERDQQLHSRQAEETRTQLDGIVVDARLLKNEVDIRALSERFQQVRKHEHDIERRRLEVDVLWKQVERLVREVGWPAATEDTLAQRLPAVLDRAAVQHLVKQFGVVEHARQAASSVVREKLAERQSIDSQLEGLSVSNVPAALRTALVASRAIGDREAATRRDEAVVGKRTRELASAMASLRPWPLEPEALRALVLPSEQAMRQQQKLHAEAQSLRSTLVAQQAQLVAAIKAQELELAQYRTAHQPVTLAELVVARAERDATWRSMKSGGTLVSSVAADFESKTSTADMMADRRHDKAREAAEMQAKLDGLERLRLQADENVSRQAANSAALSTIEATWADQSAALGLAGMSLDALEPWRAARDKVLHADEVLAEASAALDETRCTTLAAARALTAALADASVPFDPVASFETLVLVAGDAVERATETAARHSELRKQHAATVVALARHTETAEAAQSELAAWSRQWRTAMTRVRLGEATEVAVAEAALAVMAEIDEKLRSIREIRTLRIETMQRDLTDFERTVAATVSTAAPELAGLDAAAIVAELTARVGKALDDKKDAERLRVALRGHEAQAKAASDRVDRARATIQPLLQLASVSSHDALRNVIAASDAHLRLAALLDDTQKLIDDGGDGLSAEALEAEVTSVDVAHIAVRLAAIAVEIATLHGEQETNTSELTQAIAELATIDGRAGAARAESDRQDALAKMADATERFIKVRTASLLLKWAVDRYRDTKQGPMLKRASEIFRALTLGSFQKLVVDFETDQPELYGLRESGARVDISGMSDGTRNQLYLALRLAALELHLGQSHALPFIADDLFVTYDDRRARAGLAALASLSERTQVIFLSHHDHLVPIVQAVFGADVNVQAL